MSQENEFAVVTGASSGIGHATARALATRGFHVLAGVRRESDAEQLAGKNLEPVILDVTDAAQIAALADRVTGDAEGRLLRALVNNAGIAVNAPVEAIPMAEWRRQFEVNFFGQVALTQALLPALLSARGRVVNVSSIGGRVAGPTYGAYSASKFALEAMSDVLRREVARFGVRGDRRRARSGRNANLEQGHRRRARARGPDESRAPNPVPRSDRRGARRGTGCFEGRDRPGGCRPHDR